MSPNVRPVDGRELEVDPLALAPGRLQHGQDLGKQALLRIKEAGILKHRMLQFLLDDPDPLLHYGETIYQGGKLVGYIRAGAYGFTLGASVGLGFVEHEQGVNADYIKNGQFEIEVAGVRYPAKASLRPMYDPQLKRVRS